MRAPADAAALLIRALAASAAPLAIETRDVGVRPWASATFAGERITLRLRPGGDGAGWLAALPEADLPMRGWFVADLAVVEADGGDVVIEALVLEAD